MFTSFPFSFIFCYFVLYTYISRNLQGQLKLWILFNFFTLAPAYARGTSKSSKKLLSFSEWKTICCPTPSHRLLRKWILPKYYSKRMPYKWRIYNPRREAYFIEYLIFSFAEKLESDNRDTGVAVPFTNVPRRDRCIKRPPSSLTHGGSFHLQEPKKKKKEGLGSSGPSHLMPTQRKPGMNEIFHSSHHKLLLIIPNS